MQRIPVLVVDPCPPYTGQPCKGPVLLQKLLCHAVSAAECPLGPARPAETVAQPTSLSVLPPQTVISAALPSASLHLSLYGLVSLYF